MTTQSTMHKAKTISILTELNAKKSDKSILLPHAWPFPFSNGKKVIVPKVVDKKKSTKQEYPEALF